MRDARSGQDRARRVFFPGEHRVGLDPRENAVKTYPLGARPATRTGPRREIHDETEGPEPGAAPPDPPHRRNEASRRCVPALSRRRSRLPSDSAFSLLRCRKQPVNTCPAFERRAFPRTDKFAIRSRLLCTDESAFLTLFTVSNACNRPVEAWDRPLFHASLSETFLTRLDFFRNIPGWLTWSAWS